MKDDSEINSASTSAPHGQSSKKLGHRTQKYRKQWESLPGFKNWLQPAKDDDTKAYCCYCKLKLVSEITTLKKHLKSFKHVENAKSITGTKPNALSNMLQQVNPNKEQVDKVKRAEIFLSEHNISFNTADHMTKVLKQALPDSDIAKKMILRRTKATKVVCNVIGKNHKENLIKDLKNTVFIVIIDESTGVGTMKTLCICVRYFDSISNTIQSKFWELVEVFKDHTTANEGATATKIYKEIINSFLNKNVPLNNIIDFASDGCNAMMGQWNSVASRFKDDYN